MISAFGPSAGRRCAFASLPSYFCRFTKRFALVFLVTLALCGSAKAQYLGFFANSTDGTVSVFATVTSGPATFGGSASYQDHLIGTVNVGVNPVRIAVTPSPNFNRAYVTGGTTQGNSSLWVVDVTNVSQGAITASNVTNSLFQLNQPGGIAIVKVPSGATNGAANKVLAFVANQGANTVSVIDTSNNTLFGIVSLGTITNGNGTTLPEVAATADGTQVFVTNNSTANCNGVSAVTCPGVWKIDATTVAPGTIATRLLTGFTTGASVSNNVATLTMSSSPFDAGLSFGYKIWVSGFTGADSYFNGLQTITGLSSTQISFSLTHANGVATTNGMASAVISPRGIATLQVARTLLTTVPLPYVETQIMIADPSQTGVTLGIGHSMTVVDLTHSLEALAFIPGGAAASAPVSISAFCSPPPPTAASPCPLGSTLIANVSDTANNLIYQFAGNPDLIAASQTSSLPTTATPSAIATTPDGSFSYVTGARGSFVSSTPPLSGTPIFVANNFNDGPLLGNQSTSIPQGNGATGLAIASLDPTSMPVTWFFPGFPRSGGTLASNPIAVGASVDGLGESMAPLLANGGAQAVSMKLDFGTGTCTLFGGTPPAGATNGSTCQTNAGQNANLSADSAGQIGGTSTFPAAGVFTVILTGTAGSGSSSGSFSAKVSVGANCTWSPPSTVTVGVAVAPTLACTAPGTDVIKGTINWGDGTTPETKTVSANGGTPVSLSFTAHAFSTANTSGYQVTITLQDTTAGNVAGSVLPSSAKIVATLAPTLTPPSSTSLAPGESLTVPATFNGGTSNAGRTYNVSCTLTPGGGPACNVVPPTLTLDTNGQGTIQVTLVAGGSQGALRSPPPGANGPSPLLAMWIGLPSIALVFLGVAFSGHGAGARRRWGLALIMLLLLGSASIEGCSGFQQTSLSSATCTGCTPTGSYTVTLNAKVVPANPALDTSAVFTVAVTR